MKLRYRGRTDVGRTREHNEDDYGYGEGAQVERYGELLVVCDGMGGHASGEVASHLGVETIVAAYYEESGEDRTRALKQAFEQANARIHAEGHGSMGTTGVAALFFHDALHIANVGDSRAYLIRDGAIRQISRDHSLVGEQVAAGIITADQARSLYYRNVITRALGYQAEVAVDLFRWPLQPGDVVVLCSDGLHGLVSDEEIHQLATLEPLEEAVDRMVDLANERGGNDNITVLVVRVEELEWRHAGSPAESSERDTQELPTPVQTAQLQAAAPAGAPSPAPQPEPPLTHQTHAPERRLSLAGIVLSAALLLALGATIFLLRPEAALAPPAETAAPAATSVQTAEVAPSATAAPQPSVTAAPATSTTRNTPSPAATRPAATPRP